MALDDTMAQVWDDMLQWRRQEPIIAGNLTLYDATPDVGLREDHPFWKMPKEERFEVYAAIRRITSLRG